jgi:ketosteroid isomerase-like protein
MSSDDTMRVLERHGAAAAANDLEAIMADYAEDAVLISPRHGVLRGAEIRTFFERPSDMTGFEVITLLIDQEVAFFTWKTDAVPFGSDTFVVRDGRIAVQTVAMPAW